MSGTLGLSSPWARQGITPEQRAEVEAAIPDDMVLGVALEPNKSHWLLWLVRDGEVITGHLRVTRALPHRGVNPLRNACLFALAHWQRTVLA